MIRKLYVLAVAVLMTLPAACSHTAPKTTPGGKVAYQAGRVLEAINAVQHLVVDTLEPQKVITTDQAGKVMIAAYKAGDAGEKLADLCESYDLAVGAGNTTEAGVLAGRIEALLKTVETAFPKLELGPSASKLGQLVESVLTAVRQTRAAITELRSLPQGAGIYPELNPECYTRYCYAAQGV